MTARSPATTRSPVLALALALVLLLSQQFGLLHGLSHLRGGLVERGASTAPGAGPGLRGQVVAAPAAAGATSNRVGNQTSSWANSWANSGASDRAINRAGGSADSTADNSTDTLCPVCLVLTALGAASLLGLLRWLVAPQACSAPTAPARRTLARPARRQHRARAPPAALALT